MNEEGAGGPPAREEALLCPGPEATQVLPASARHPTGALTVTRALAFQTSPPHELARPTSEGGVARLTRTGPRSDFLQQSPHQPGLRSEGAPFSVESEACLFSCG